MITASCFEDSLKLLAKLFAWFSYVVGITVIFSSSGNVLAYLSQFRSRCIKKSLMPLVKQSEKNFTSEICIFTILPVNQKGVTPA